MEELILGYRQKLLTFYSLYGKVTSVLFLFCASLLVGCLIIYSSSVKKLQISFLDVGQGDAIFIQTPSGHDMLIDGGAHDKVLEKISQKMGYFDRHIDVIVATHPDADHITGLVPILKKYTIDTIITSSDVGQTNVFEEFKKTITEEQAKIINAKRGDQIIFGDGVVVDILYPTKNLNSEDVGTNDASVSLVLTYGNQSVLLTGDLSTKHEGNLFGKTLPRNITIYKAGHHGSKYSNGEQLLSYIKPEYTVISTGKNNKYNHPNPEAVLRLQTYSQEIFSTIEKGTITFLLDGRSLVVSSEK